MSNAKATKKSAFSCDICRQRKVKCGGEQPICKRCASRGVECGYSLNPTLSYTQRLEKRIVELEKTLSARPDDNGQPSLAPISADNQASNQQNPKQPSQPLNGLKVDNSGGITYHGPTSFFNLPRNPATTASDVSLDEGNAQRRERLVVNAWQERSFENLSSTPAPFHHLLNIHWCWVQPVFNFIYRPAFSRDMQMNGPYFSQTLLTTILSHSIRWAKNDDLTMRQIDAIYGGGTNLAECARTMLFEELRQGVCSIPTAQTLLLLSARECSSGNSGQAWMYSGIAFRMIDHLGICVDGTRFPGSIQLTDEDVEIRRRLFWSCYFWDKMISLYLGRSPSVHCSGVSPSLAMSDDSTDNDLWFPFGSKSQNTWQYPPCAAHSTSCFTKICQLSVILNEILIHMYDPLQQNTPKEIIDCLRSQGTALLLWWDNLPPSLKIDVFALPPLAPPSHIVTLNFLYHALKILLHRRMLPFRGKTVDEESSAMPHHLQECVTSATSIIAAFDLFCKTFGIGHCVLSQLYSVYIAATIFLLQIQATPHDSQALGRLEFCLNALDKAKDTNNVISSALSVISEELHASGIELQSFRSHDTSSQPNRPAYDVLTSEGTTAQSDLADTIGTSTDIEPELMSENAWNIDFDPAHMVLDPGLLEALSTIEPLSVSVAAISDFDYSNQTA
ncbi:fungal-specific transcription factor domain-containing protein [Truncatella angustata]|uniref:Fungal-specific transcription factor domain-containing protein n=1 Tax=Truncatella angustata TaxID=152316 RepID=A0A9P8RFI8_9PEZI|nr:fungal-specific transcription factor domain-containing protein [Truncatella angustata]KAH6645084.1 fungal-specific transcription factor domain-containing protein [Truncatella angustata]